MIQEQELFFRVLKEYIHEETPSFQESTINTERFYEIVKSQSMQGIFFAQCKKALPCESLLYKMFYKGFLSEVFQTVNRQNDFQELVELYREKQLPFLLMKGIDVAKYYPEPYLRTMGDLDLIIHERDRERCHAIMQEQGFELESKGTSVWTYVRDVVRYEIHNRMFHSELPVDFDYCTYFDKVWDLTKTVNDREEILPEIHFLYLIVHMAKHISNSGYGMRTFLDLVFIWKNCKEMDWALVERELEQLKLLDFTRTCFSLCEYWFDLDIPLGKMNLDKAFIDKVSEKIFEDGLWGHKNVENIVGAMASISRRVALPYVLVVVNEARRKFFPSYQMMNLDSRFPFVHGRPWLLPFAWVYRWIYLFINKREESSRSAFEPFTWSKEVKEREEYLKSWGL